MGFPKVIIFKMKMKLRHILLFANLKFHCFQAECIGFVRLHHNDSLRSDSGEIFVSAPERSDFHSTNGSLVYRIGVAQCNSSPYPIQKSFRSDSNPV